MRIVGHHTLVHAVECQFLAVGREESAFVDAKFVAVHRLAVDYLARPVAAHLHRLGIAAFHIQIVVLKISPSARLLVPLQLLSAIFESGALGARVIDYRAFAAGFVDAVEVLGIVGGELVAIPSGVKPLGRHFLIVFAAEV